MVVLVTGGAGFVGRHVCKELHEAGIDNFSLDNFDILCGSDPRAAAIRADITDREELDRAILSYGVTDIIHLAAYGRNLTCRDFPADAWDVNVTGTRNVLEAARVHKLERVVLCSSNIVLSSEPTFYKTTKQTVEALGEAYSRMGVPVTTLRPSNIYGEGQSRTEYQPCAFASLDQQYAVMGRFQISGNGTQTRDWVHVKDVASAFHVALFADITNPEPIDICTGKQYSMNDIADTLGVSVDYVPSRPGDAQVIVSSPWLMNTRLQFAPKYALHRDILDAFPAVAGRLK